ncbi:filamentous hemagglutinin N-terminal domain-containing protein [Haemophilus influenzae]|uniref:two-partner secretion domain-containing protein n=3 Tax=Haemophilus influenzae TaxID=727 RepID=UPI003D7D6892
MNKIYRLKFSKRLNQLVAVSEITAGHDRHSGCQNAVDTVSSFQMTKWLKLKPLASLISLLSFGFATQTAMANGLQGMEVVSGSASMSINGKNTTITNSPDAIINWKQFNINQDELVRFVQENSNSAVFNRVTSDQISQLKGALNSNGHVFLINPNGIVMGKDAVINAAGFTASTLNISDKDLKARNFNFEQAKDKAMAQIVNNGLISVSKNGSVNLIGGSVKNNGVIKVEDGNILLLAGQKVTISDITNPTITYSVVAPKNEAVNLGTIFAKNGKIQIHAGSVVNKGTLNANSVSKDKSGTIILSAKEGEANIDGTVTLNNANFKAGSLTITGKKVVLNSGAKVELTGKQGGTVYIGGDEHGQGKIQLAEKTEIKQGASVNVSGSEKGGKAIVWGDRAQVDGEIIAKGKDKKNSGFVETSGYYLGIGKTAKVEAKEWLLDPYNVRIVDGNTNTNTNTITSTNTDNKSVFTATADDAVIVNTTITNALNAGTNVEVTTGIDTNPKSRNKKGDLTVEANIIKTSGGDATLTLTANNKFTQKENTKIKSEHEKLNVTINSGNGLELKGEIDTNEGDLKISTGGNATLDGATVKGKGAISINAENSGNSNRTLEVKGNTTLKGYGDEGLSITVSDKAKIKGTWEGDINVTGNVSYVHTLSDHTKESHHDWAANLTVDNGKFTFSDLNNHNKIVNDVSQHEAILDISKAVKFNVKNSTDTITFDVRQHGSHAGTSSLLKGNKDYVSKLATHINGNLTVQGDGKVNITSTTPYNSVVGGILIKANNITTAGNATLNLTGKAESEDTVNPPAIVVESDLTLNASGDSKINLHGSGALGSTVIYVGKNVRNYVGDDYKTDSNKRSLTLKGNNINITASQNIMDKAGSRNAAKITITGDLTSDAKNVYLGEKDDVRGVNINVYGNTTFNSGNVTLNNHSENVNATINLNNLMNNANLNIKGSKVTFNGKTNSKNSMNVEATNDADNVILVNGDFTSTGNLDITANGGMLAPANTAYQFDFKGEHTNITLKKDLQLRGKVNTNNTVNWTADKIKLGGDINQEGGHLTLTTKTQDIQTDATNKDVNGEKTNSEHNTITFNGNAQSKLTINTSALNGNYGKIKFKNYGESNLTLNSIEGKNEVVLKGNHAEPSKMGIAFENSTLNVGAAKLKVETTVTGNDLAVKKADGNANLDVEITNSGKLNSTGQTSVDATNVTNNGAISGANVALTATEAVINNATATVTATTGDATLTGKNVSNSGTVTATEGKVGVTATENFTNTETGNLKGGNVEVTANQDAIIKGTVSGTSVALDGKNSLTIEQNTQVTATTDATLKGKTIEQKGTVTAKQNATLEGNTITNSGTVTAETGKVGVTATENFTNTETGNLTGNNVDVKAKNALNEGEIHAEEGNLTVKADETFVNTESGILDAKAKVEVKAEDATIAGEISGGVVSLTADKTLDIAKDSFVTAKTGEAKLSGDTITNAGTVVAKEGEVSVNAIGTFTNTADGNLAAKNAVDIKAKDAEIAGKVVSKEGTLTVNATHDLTVKENADLSAKNKVTLAATNDLTTEVGSTVKSMKGDVVLTGNNITNGGTVAATEGNVGVTATEKFTNTATGNLTGKNNVTVTAENAEVAGTVMAETGAANITATNDLSIKEGSKVSGGSVGLKAGENLNVAGNAQVTATTDDVNLEGKNIINAGNVTAEMGNVNVNAKENFTNQPTGNLNAKGKVTVNAETGNVDNKGVIDGQQATSVTAGQNVTNHEGAEITSAEGKVAVNAQGGSVANDGLIQGKTGTAVAAKTDVNNGESGKIVSPAGDVTVNTETGNVDNKGVIDGQQATSVTAGQNVTNHEGAEITSAEGKVAVNAQGGSVANDGLIQGKTGTAVAAKTDVNNGESGKIVSPAGDVTVNTETGNVDNKGVIDGQQATSVTAGQNVTNHEGAEITSAEGKVAVNAQGGSVANDGLIQGKTGTAVAAKTDVNNGESGKIVSPAGDVTVNTETGNVDNKGVIDGQQATSVTAGQNVTNHEGAEITSAEGKVAVNAQGGSVANDGLIQGKTGTAVAAKTDVNNGESGKIVSPAGDVTVNTETGNVDNKGVIDGQQATSVTAGQNVTNHEGAEITSAEGKVAVNAQGGSVANDGLIQGKTGTAVAAKTDVNNGESGKIVSPAGDVTVNTETGNVDNKGVIDGQQATSVTSGQNVTNHEGAKIISTEGDVDVITNGTLDNNGLIQGKTGTTVVEAERQSKDNLMSDLINTLGDMERTVRSNLSTAENEQYPSSNAKSLMFYDKGRVVNKVASIMSNGSVCSVVLPAGKNIADGRLLTSCLAENEKSKSQYHKQSEKVGH